MNEYFISKLVIESTKSATKMQILMGCIGHYALHFWTLQPIWASVGYPSDRFTSIPKIPPICTFSTFTVGIRALVLKLVLPPD